MCNYAKKRFLEENYCFEKTQVSLNSLHSSWRSNRSTYVALLLSESHTASLSAQCCFGQMDTHACLLDCCSPGQSEGGIKMENNQFEGPMSCDTVLHIQNLQDIPDLI